MPQPLPPIAVVAGARTPFAKAFGVLKDIPTDQLGSVALRGAIAQAGLTPSDIDEVVIGNVGGQPDASNVARVIALRAGVPTDRIAHTVNRNCASGMEAIVSAWHILCEGRAGVVAAGGAESMSNLPLLWSRQARDWFQQWSQAKLGGKLRLLLQLRPSMFKPIPAVLLGLTDPICGLNMGQTAEVLAKEFGIRREEQDQFALQSHLRAAAAWQAGFFAEEVVPIPAELTGGQAVTQDVGFRPHQTLEALAKLPPIFDRGPEGTVTAGNSCPITDGAVAVVLMRADDPRAVSPLGYIRGYAIAGCEPRRMGLGPVYAIHRLLQTSGLRLEDFDLIEINEAFAAQVLACMRAMASAEFARKELHAAAPVGELDFARLNVHGGAIALGHPVGATGTRLVLTLLRALRQRGLRRGLAALCVGGGQGFAMWVETERPT